MSITDAIKVIECHIKWRTGEEIDMIGPSVLTESEKLLVEYAKECLSAESGWLGK